MHTSRRPLSFHNSSCKKEEEKREIQKVQCSTSSHSTYIEYGVWIKMLTYVFQAVMENSNLEYVQEWKDTQD